MSFIDSMIAAVSPKKAYEREAWRQGLEAMRGYDAAGFGRINSGWRAHNESAEITDRYSRDVVRARARDLERNSDILQAVVLAYKRNVVGKGFTLRARTGDDDLNRQIELIYPEHNAILYLPKGFSGKSEKFIFKAAHARRDATIYWHLDESYLGETTDNHQISCSVGQGKHLLTLIDNEGNQKKIQFEVK